MLLVHILYEGRHLLSAGCPAASGTWQLAAYLVSTAVYARGRGQLQRRLRLPLCAGTTRTVTDRRGALWEAAGTSTGELIAPRPLETGPKGPLIMSPKLPA